MKQNPSQLLSDLIINSKYAKLLPDKHRKETWDEIVDRVRDMHIEKFPFLSSEIENAFEFVRRKDLLPSMRSLQFAGDAIKRNNMKQFNCAYHTLESVTDFAEHIYLLLCGTGVGYSVEKHHIDKLPVIQRPTRPADIFVVPDSIEGWADAVKAVMAPFFHGGPDTILDVSKVRPVGSPISSGGTAPGPQPLIDALDKTKLILLDAIGRKLTSLEVHSICCHLAECVVAGGVRRSAQIVLFDKDDTEMLTCKTGQWWEHNNHLQAANNSVLLDREAISRDDFLQLIHSARHSGEPGVMWLDASTIGNYGGNPCLEILLKPKQVCNLVELNGPRLNTADGPKIVRAGAFINTLQATYTDFPYLTQEWEDVTASDALTGLSVTGIADTDLDLDYIECLAKIALETNEYWADILGINKATRVTAVKPAGTTSAVLGVSSGIHNSHAKYYIRRMELGKHEPIHDYLKPRLGQFMVDSVNKRNCSVIEFPVERSHYKPESANDLFQRVLDWNRAWVRTGTRANSEGHNNVSATVTVDMQSPEADALFNRMYDHRDEYTGVSVFPASNGVYQQMPFETITEERYNELIALWNTLPDVDLTKVVTDEKETPLAEVACAGGACDIFSI